MMDENNRRYVWIIDLNTNECTQHYLSEDRIEWFKNSSDFRVEE
jgi:hypothetical protein